ncbi:hypothetical protein CYMTET_45635 [Cymbomonas tetramitiformis]|uniref:Uncharacterized protein n=1 Tax=Cymbomonas tetramitiformis TaxID=36881 RepID=A0AAE0BXV0_9CHLO|nr:hypothetical protein CYMTET_51144 [Cymbomonas tetramitiformis]KAK3244768.1 hypothetical protein CYMTET_45635 [Cymbomonas tetramitiformis]
MQHYTARYMPFAVFLLGITQKALAEVCDGVEGQTHSLTWEIPMDPQEIEIAVCDTLELSWSGTHNVYGWSDSVNAQEWFETCNFTNANEAASSSQSSFTHQYTEAGPYYGVCTIGSHCENGQKIKVIVKDVTASPTAMPTTSPTSPPSGSPTASPTSSPSSSLSPTSVCGGVEGQTHSLTWEIPMDPQEIEIAVCDTLELSWSGTHNVYGWSDSVNAQEWFETCNFTNANEAASSSQSSFTHQYTEAGPYYGVCTIGSHCENGQKIKVIVKDVTASPTATGSPTSSPSSSLSPTKDAVSPMSATLSPTILPWCSSDYSRIEHLKKIMKP